MIFPGEVINLCLVLGAVDPGVPVFLRSLFTITYFCYTSEAYLYNLTGDYYYKLG